MTAKISGIIKNIIDVYRDFYDPATARAVADSLLMSDRNGDDSAPLFRQGKKTTKEATSSVSIIWRAWVAWDCAITPETFSGISLCSFPYDPWTVTKRKRTSATSYNRQGNCNHGWIFMSRNRVGKLFTFLSWIMKYSFQVQQFLPNTSMPSWNIKQSF